MRKRRLSFNTLSSLLLQAITIISGLILPRLVIRSYGSQINGLVNSISQFLSVISVLEFGVGAVIQSALYEPLAVKDNKMVSRIVVSSDNFFRRIGIVLSVYICILVFIYPSFFYSQYDWIFTATLIISMSIGLFAQYFLGMTDRLLLTADQQNYIYNIAQTITLILNTIFGILLIYTNCSIQTVKLATSLLYLFRPVIVRIYIKRNYNLNRNIKLQDEPIKQKWNGIAQHLAYIILEGTDTIVLTIFTSLRDVSVYSAYYLIISGIKQLYISLCSGFQALLGELWVRQDKVKLKKTFCLLEWLIHTAVIFVYGCTSTLIVPFVQIYTNGVNDAEYKQPVFALLIVLAYAVYCLAIPYQIMILAAGHYQQTQYKFMAAAVLNIVVSVIAVEGLGLIGVAIGTLVAMIYQLFWMLHYNIKKLEIVVFSHAVKQWIGDMIISFLGIVATNNIELQNLAYSQWIIMAVKTALIWASIIFGINVIFYRYRVIYIVKQAFKKCKNK